MRGSSTQHTLCRLGENDGHGWDWSAGGEGQSVKEVQKKNVPGIHHKLYEDTQFEGAFLNVFQTISRFHTVGGTCHCLLHSRTGILPSSKVTHTQKSN